MDLASLRDEVRDLTFALETLRHADAAGHGPAVFAATFRGKDEVLSPESFAYLRELEAKADGRRARRLRALATQVFRLGAQRRSAAALEARRQVEFSSKISGLEAGEQLSLRAAAAALADAGDREKRRALEQRVAEALLPVARPSASVMEAANEWAAIFGLGTALDAVRRLGEIDTGALVADAEAFLEATQAMYEDVLTWWLRRTTGLRPHPHGAESHDLAWALALHELAGLFPRRDLLTQICAPFAAAGLPARAVSFDLDDRPHKLPLAVTALSRDDLRVTLRRSGGHRDTRTLLDALGQATALTHVDPARPFEDFGCGDEAITLAYGGLFASLLLDRDWLRRVLSAEAPDLVRVLALVELARTRAEVSRAIFALSLHRDGAGRAAADRFAERQAAVTLGRTPAGLAWLTLEPDPFASVAGLRALALAPLLADSLRDRFDADWWRNPAGLAALRGLMAEGRLPSAADRAKALGAESLRLLPIARRFEGLLA